MLTDPGGLPVLGVDNWSSGWLPSLYQGTVDPPDASRGSRTSIPPPHLQGRGRRSGSSTTSTGSTATTWPTTPASTTCRPGSPASSWPRGCRRRPRRPSTSRRESPATPRLYGLDDPETREFGTRCLIARRLVERGVRFVQVCTGNQNWDHHGGIVKRLPEMCRKVDRPSAALVTDLQQRGLLDSTVVFWGGEMGRLPVIQNEKNIGRDHNTYGFSGWLAGGGFKGGHVHGATDELGHKAVEDVVTHSDYHATLLHLFGLDHANARLPPPQRRGLAGRRPAGADRPRAARLTGRPAAPEQTIGVTAPSCPSQAGRPRPLGLDPTATELGS